MRVVKSNLHIAIVSSQIPKTPSGITYSFVFDEAWRLSKRGAKIHAVRGLIERGPSYAYQIHFHGLGSVVDFEVPSFLVRHLSMLPVPFSFTTNPILLFSLYRYGLNVAKVVKQFDMDILHAHFAYPEGFVGLLAKRETKKPLVVTLHGYDILTAPSVGYGIRLSRKCNIIINKVLKEADAVIVGSSATYSEALAAGADKEKLKLIPNGVDLNKFRPDVDGDRVRDKFALHGRFIVFTLRRHEPKNGIEYLIRAIPRILRKIREAHFLIAGDGKLRHYHERLAKELGIGENITFTGQISQEAIPQFYAASDVVVVPSLQEAFGLVITEAMASGKPVIGSNVGGIPDQIINDYNGFLVEPKDPYTIAEKILYLYEHQNETQDMGKRSRRIAEETFNIESRIDRILLLYKEMAEE